MTVRMADYFQCTADFLLGLESENYAHTFKPYVPFRIRFPFLLDHFGLTRYRLMKITGVSETTIIHWWKGTREPSIDSIARVARAFDCTVDFVLGRST